jgi:myo-inositol-1(or 4)-monophosphatase
VTRDSELRRRLEVAQQAARAAGAVHLRYFGTNIRSEAKTSPQDVLTMADLEAQAAAKAVIEGEFPRERIVGEEDDLSRRDLTEALEGACWLVDPLDGTQSYVHDFPFFGPGIAWVEARTPLAGVAYLPIYDEMFGAARGLGASLNGAPIRVAPPRRLSQALVNLHIREVSPAAVEQFLATVGRVLPAAHGVRLLGSPMLSLAYVACGRLDASATLSPTRLGPWDVAPACVILEEAGGVVTTQHNTPFEIMETGLAGASSRALLDELFAVARPEGER